MTARSRGLWGWSFCAATALTLIGTTEEYASRVLEGLPANWLRLLRLELLQWYTWALLAPLAFALLSRPSPAHVGRLRVVARWSALALGFVACHTVLEVIPARGLRLAGAGMALGTMLLARFTSTLAPNLVLFGLIGLAAQATRNADLARKRERRETELQTQLARAQLGMLRNQLQPHFFFNTLHTVSALMAADVLAAQRLLADLAELLRLSLTHTEAHEVPLEQELSFLQRYLEIERTRFRDRLQTEIIVDPAVREVLVPSMLLQPLTENALRHAIAPRAGPGRIWFRARREGASAVLEVEDDGDASLAEGAQPRAAGGVGLSNTRERLERLYGAAGRLDVLRGAAGGWLVRITLPCRNLVAPAPAPSA